MCFSVAHPQRLPVRAQPLLRGQRLPLPDTGYLNDHGAPVVIEPRRSAFFLPLRGVASAAACKRENILHVINVSSAPSCAHGYTAKNYHTAKWYAIILF